jgi:thioredoxin-like negative regulator of GroEL
LNSDDYPEIAKTYEVKGLPTALLFIDGKAAEKFVGLVPRDNMERVLEFHL